jgi:hypothetical protein
MSGVIVIAQAGWGVAQENLHYDPIGYLFGTI